VVCTASAAACAPSRLVWRISRWLRLRSGSGRARSRSRRAALTVGRVVDGGDDAGGQDNLLPGLANVQDVDTVGPGLPQVGLHVNLEVLGTEVALGSEEHLNVLLGGVEDGGEVGGGHFDGMGTAAAACRSV
jgi:hypothetical protein